MSTKSENTRTLAADAIEPRPPLQELLTENRSPRPISTPSKSRAVPNDAVVAPTAPNDDDTKPPVAASVARVAHPPRPSVLQDQMKAMLEKETPKYFLRKKRNQHSQERYEKTEAAHRKKMQQILLGSLPSSPKHAVIAGSVRKKVAVETSPAASVGNKRKYFDSSPTLVEGPKCKRQKVAGNDSLPPVHPESPLRTM